MGQVHNELRRGGLSEALTRAVGDTRGGGMERFGETLQPIINLWGLPEWALLRKELLFYSLREAAAVAAEFSMIALTLNPNSRSIVVLERVQAGINAAAADVQIIPINRAYALGTLTTVSPQGHSLDQRSGESATPGGGAIPGVELWAGSDAVDPGANGLRESQRNIAAQEKRDFVTLPRILRPNFGVLVYGNTVNTMISAIFVGRIRATLASEPL